MMVAYHTAAEEDNHHSEDRTHMVAEYEDPDSHTWVVHCIRVHSPAEQVLFGNKELAVRNLNREAVHNYN